MKKSFFHAHEVTKPGEAAGGRALQPFFEDAPDETQERLTTETRAPEEDVSEMVEDYTRAAPKDDETLADLIRNHPHKKKSK